MIQTRSASILERVPHILAVTAASYGLAAPPRARAPGGAGVFTTGGAAHRLGAHFVREHASPGAAAHRGTD